MANAHDLLMAHRAAMMAKSNSGSPVVWLFGFRFNSAGEIISDSASSSTKDFIPFTGGHRCEFRSRSDDESAINGFFIEYDIDHNRVDSWGENTTPTRVITTNDRTRFVRFSVRFGSENVAYIKDYTTGLYVLQNGYILI